MDLRRRHPMQTDFSKRQTESPPAGSSISPKSALAAVAMLGASALVGCGAGGASTKPGVVVQALTLKSPALNKTHTLASRYACTKHELTLPLKWGSLPANTASLAVVVFQLSEIQKTAEGTFRAKLSPDSAVAEMSPKIKQITFHGRPAGAIAGRRPYAICPAKGIEGSYVVRLYALPEKSGVKPGFDETKFVKQVTNTALAVGTLTFHYQHS
jgi:phosphatidylethanolamine-binding protein (PEBP) family uncharacterized protein